MDSFRSTRGTAENEDGWRTGTRTREPSEVEAGTEGGEEGEDAAEVWIADGRGGKQPSERKQSHKHRHRSRSQLLLHKQTRVCRTTLASNQTPTAMGHRRFSPLRRRRVLH